MNTAGKRPPEGGRMMKCKDCIHYTAHKHFYFGEEDFDEYFNDDNVESQCPEFEDKREWGKLPCKEDNTEAVRLQNGYRAVLRYMRRKMEHECEHET